MVNSHVRILLIGSNIWYLSDGLLGPLFAVFSEKIGGSILDITGAWAVYLIVTGVLNIIVGKLSDGPMNKAKLMVIGYAVNTVFTFGYLFVSQPAHLFFVQLGLGVSTALATPTWQALYAKYEDRKSAGFEWGLAGGQSSIIMGLGVILGGVIVTKYSFSALFLIMGFIQLMATIIQSRILFMPKKR